jgi:hypothetical protein
MMTKVTGLMRPMTGNMQFQEQDYFKNKIFRSLRTRSISRENKCYENEILHGADINIRTYNMTCYFLYGFVYDMVGYLQ